MEGGRWGEEDRGVKRRRRKAAVEVKWRWREGCGAKHHPGKEG